MDRDDVKWEWRKILGKIRNKWGRIVDDETMKIEDRLDAIARKVQCRYGKTKKEAVKMVSDFFKK
jgi:uncharacterized protein YjbJ (UPF0337 family)